MQTKRRGTIIGSFAILFAFVGEAVARPIPIWNYNNLFKSSDLILIVRPVSTRDATEADRVIPPKFDPDILAGVVSHFQVAHVVKGAYGQKEFDLVHFRVNANELRKRGGLVNGPFLASFPVKKDRPPHDGDDMHGTCYMLFLKKQGDGRFECVSGQYDSAFSVKEMKNTP